MHVCRCADWKTLIECDAHQPVRAHTERPAFTHSSAGVLAKEGELERTAEYFSIPLSSVNPSQYASFNLRDFMAQLVVRLVSAQLLVSMRPPPGMHGVETK